LPDADALVTVFETGDAGLVAIATSLLDDAQIEYFAQGALSIRGRVRFRVQREDEAAARAALAGLDEPGTPGVDAS
jgi:hypothetical protein